MHNCHRCMEGPLGDPSFISLHTTDHFLSLANRMYFCDPPSQCELFPAYDYAHEHMVLRKLQSTVYKCGECSPFFTPNLSSYLPFFKVPTGGVQIHLSLFGHEIICDYLNPLSILTCGFILSSRVSDWIPLTIKYCLIVISKIVFMMRCNM